MSLDADNVVSRLDSYLGKVLTLVGKLYVLSSHEIFLAGSDLYWEHKQILRLQDKRAADVARTIASFAPAWGGGRASWIIDATVRGKVTRSEEAESMAWLSEIEEVEVRHHWLTARMRLRQPPDA